MHDALRLSWVIVTDRLLLLVKLWVDMDKDPEFSRRTRDVAADETALE